MIEMPTTPGTSTVANFDSSTLPPPPPMPWPIFGNTNRNTNTSRNGWINVRITNSHLFFHSTTRSRRINARSAMRLAAIVERVGSITICARGTATDGAAISRATPCP